MKLLNAEWHPLTFHQRLVELAKIAPGESVIDLGCGHGATLEPMLEAVGPDGKVVALDRDSAGLQTVAERFAAAIAKGSLATIEHDVSYALPFPDCSFDVVLSQNLIECVTDRSSLLKDCGRILRDHGRLFIAHHDYDGVLLASDDRELTRRLIHAFADYKQQWQNEFDGQMGRQLPGIVARAGYSSLVTETLLFVDLAPTAGSYAAAYLEWVVALGPRLGIEEVEIAAWRAGLQERAQKGEFYFGIPWVYVSARRS